MYHRGTLIPELVSIVTPAFNAERFIAQTLTSVIQQTYPAWELLVADDCSRDGTRALVERHAAGEPRVKPILLSRNSGPAAARQAAIDAAQGRYIAFLDSDDLWLPDKLERQLEFMKSRDAALSFTAYRRISADGAKVGRLIAVPECLSYRQLLGNTAIATSTAIVDRGKSGPLRMTRTYYDDFVLWLDITRRGFDACGLNEDLMRYRVVGGSVSRNKSRSARMVWRTYRGVEKLGLLHASWCFARYALNAARKYRSF